MHCQVTAGNDDKGTAAVQMNFDFTEEQKLFADSVRRFALVHLENGALKRAHEARFPFDVAKLMAAQGLMGITLAEADGGQGGTLMDAVIAIEQIAAVCPRSADVVQFGNFGPIRTFAEYATPAQKMRWLPALLKGDMVMSLGMSEPDAGSAVTELKASARPDGSHYVINGTKVFSTFSPDAVDLSHLRALRARTRRHRLGDRRARARRDFPSANHRAS